MDAGRQHTNVPDEVLHLPSFVVGDLAHCEQNHVAQCLDTLRTAIATGRHVACRRESNRRSFRG